MRRQLRHKQLPISQQYSIYYIALFMTVFCSCNQRRHKQFDSVSNNLVYDWDFRVKSPAPGVGARTEEALEGVQSLAQYLDAVLGGQILLETQVVEPVDLG